MTTVQTAPAARSTAIILTASEVRRLAETLGAGAESRRTYLEEVAEEIADFNRRNSNPFYSWVALVTPSSYALHDPIIDGTFELLRTQVPNPRLD